MKYRRLLAMPLLAVTLLSTSCGGGKRFDAYMDSSNFTDGSLEMSFTNAGGYITSGNFYLTFDINLISRSPQPCTFNAGNKTIIRESNGATYRVGSTMISSKITLECDIKNTYFCTVTIPTSINSENYYLKFEYNDNNVAVFHFYNRPVANI